MRLQIIFLVISAGVYFLTGLQRKYSLRQRLVFALAMYVALFVTVATMVLITGDKPY